MRLLKNISYTIFSNILNIIVSAVIVLVIPKFIGVREYGFWQVFIFYVNYVGVLHLGWADGIFLRRGGQDISSINVEELKTESLYFFMYNSLIGLFIIIGSIFFSTSYCFIVIALGMSVVVVNTRTWITMILQSFGLFRSYAVNLSAQSIVYFVLILVILVTGVKDYRLMILSFIISQFTTCVSGVIQLNKYFQFNKVHFDCSIAFSEMKKNIDAGFKLMVANSTALLIVGVIRFGIQQEWSVSTFGKVSLVLSIANLVTVFINAVSLVLFPTLRRSKQIPSEVYVGIRNVLMPLLYILVLLYFPIKFILPIWLPKYADVMKYAVILIPMMLYQGKFEILSNTFMKNFRMEAKLMGINLFTLATSIFLTIISVYINHNISFAIISIAVVMGIRSVLSEIILSKKMNIQFKGELFFENIVVVGFMYLAWNVPLYFSMIVYFITLLIYIIIMRKKIKNGLGVLRILSKY